MYVEEYRKYPPVIVCLVGPRGHGKTVFAGALIHALRKLPENWPKFYPMFLHEEGLEKAEEILGTLKSKDLPLPNPRVLPEPLLIRLRNMGILRSVTLIIYDVTGEVFEPDGEEVRPEDRESVSEKMKQYAKYVTKANAVLFLHSVSPVEDAADSLHRLLQDYKLAMDKMGASTEKQHLVVAYTKADDVMFPINFQDLNAHVEVGSLDRCEKPRRYLQRVKHISRRVKDLTLSSLAASLFETFAANEFRSVSYALISALGAPPVPDPNYPTGKKMSEPLNPKRVVDPLLLIIEKSLPWWRRRYRIPWTTVLTTAAVVAGASTVALNWY